ncbi:MAG TPA: SDR family NAD(P)-dependent oxidoreductase, partial [Burkholderiales bacterium]
MLLQSDTALVTGTGGGIGLAIAQALEDEGAKVLRSDVKDADLSQPGAAQALAARAIRELGQVSIFVHAASPPRRETQTALAVTEAEWRA